MNEYRKSGFSGREACPACREQIAVDSPDWFGETRCPGCREALFWLRVGPQRRWPARRKRSDLVVFYHDLPGSNLRKRLIQSAARVLNVDENKITPQTLVFSDLGADSLDTVELLMEMEEAEDER